MNNQQRTLDTIIQWSTMIALFIMMIYIVIPQLPESTFGTMIGVIYFILALIASSAISYAVIKTNQQ